MPEFEKFNINKSSKYIEVILLILVSFSPLISQSFKALIILIMIVMNYKILVNLKNLLKYQSLSSWKSLLNNSNTSVISVFFIIFAIGFFLDFRNISSISEISPLSLYFPACILLGYIISEKYSLNSYLKHVDNIMIIVASISLIGVFIFTFYDSVVFRLPSYNYYHTSHKTAYIFNFLLIAPDKVLKRNSGIAWEPGAFQLLLNLGLYAHLKVKNNKLNLFKVVIYSMAIITTKSTAGILIFIVLIIKIFIDNKNTRFWILLSMIVFGGVIMDEMIYQYRFKLFGSVSFQIRLDPLLDAFRKGKNHLFGLGNTGFDTYRYNYTPPWDSFGQIFMRYGYPLFIFINYRLSSLFRDNRIIIVIFVISFASQNIWFFPLITPFYFQFNRIKSQTKVVFNYKVMGDKL